MKFSIDEVVGWNATRFIIRYIGVEQNENIQNDRAFDALPESIIDLIKNPFWFYLKFGEYKRRRVFVLVDLGTVTYLELFW